MPLLLVILAPSACTSHAQAADQESLPEKIQKLSDAMASTQAQLEQSQHQLQEMRKELSELQRQMAQSGAAMPSPAPSDSASAASSSSEGTFEELAAAVLDIRERQAIEESQIATHEQTKVESESRYPIKVTGMVLLNGFVNTGAVDMAATPTVALPGAGSTGASVRQTVLGIDARGPHLFGARSFADLRMDFASSPALNTSTTSYPSYYNANSTLLRLRTAHAGLQWDRTQAFFSLDHPIFSPETPTSLTAVAEPALAWSGNLWTWNPQAGVTTGLGHAGSRGVQLQAALIDAGDAPLTPVIALSGIATAVPPSSSEQSSRPGVEARVALFGSNRGDDRNHIGFGGYFAPHRSSLGRSFDSWAGTLDTRVLLVAGLQLTGSFYRGLGLGGLGGGAYKDFAYRPNPNTGGYYFRALDDVGGWTQLKEKLSERLEFNGAYGMDNVFSGQMRRYIVPGGTMFQNLTINRTFTGNVIYAPSAYLLFSLEYRYLKSSPIAGLPAQSNIISLGAGYKF
ncbi:MAG TPA: hypothetical protein VGT08_14810 [Terracidiphilus sp.]|nr:hypothetical protein [Terracidiphilus sp.]